RILLAEDNPTNRRVVQLILESAGVQLSMVENGAEAVQACADEDFSLVLMDLQMPVMSGLEAIAAIRRREAEQERDPVRIVVLSANAMPEDVRISLDAGANGHLAKPISAAALLEAVAAIGFGAGAGAVGGDRAATA